MQTAQTIINANANRMNMIPDKSVALIVTSPPYPMIEMWDEIFIKQNYAIADDLQNNPYEAFNKMHKILDEVWKECERVLIDGGFACINIGDATRTFNDKFQLFSNHTKIIESFLNLGFTVLPDIHWRKQTNSPNKFMGSGMYPAGAYVTYEHEYILIFRKGNKRIFDKNSKVARQESAYFWEERNIWFSDLWDVKGTKQYMINGDRERNGSYPIEIPYRLINMYSTYGDIVLDPFAGLGTTNLACMLTGRDGIGIEISYDIKTLALERLMNTDIEMANKCINRRIATHNEFINSLSEDKKEKCYKNANHDFMVKTKQEQKMQLYKITSIDDIDDIIVCEYKKHHD